MHDSTNPSMAPVHGGRHHAANERLQAEVARRIVRRHAGHVLELARRGDLRFGRQRRRLRALRRLGGAVLAAGRSAGRTVGRIGDQLLDGVPGVVGGLIGVVAESDQFGVVCGRIQLVEIILDEALNSIQYNFVVGFKSFCLYIEKLVP